MLEKSLALAIVCLAVIGPGAYLLRIAEALSRVSQAQARLREVHLGAHLVQIGILTPAQVARYNALRGYGG